MDPVPQTRTSASLLDRLRFDGATQEDWSRFVNRYGPLIKSWGRRWKIQEADLDDVVQDVLTRLTSKLRTFEYDPEKSFRSYVKTLAHFTWCDLIENRRKSRTNGSGDSGVFDQLDNLEAKDDLQKQLADAFDLEVYEEAIARVRLRIEARTWEAFRLTAVEGLSGAETAEKTGMEIPTVFKAKSKVQKMLREEIQRIEGNL